MLQNFYRHPFHSMYVYYTTCTYIHTYIRMYEHTYILIIFQSNDKQ